MENYAFATQFIFMPFTDLEYITILHLEYHPGVS